MSKHGSCKYQVSSLINPKIKFGQSKHAAKISEHIQASREGKRINRIKVDDIYCHKTFSDIFEHTYKFSMYLKTEKNKPLKEATQDDVDEYLSHLQSKQQSPATLKLVEYAISKATGIHTRLRLRPLRRSEITRSRFVKAHDSYVEENNKQIIDFILACGCRRKGLESVRYKDIFEKRGRWYVHLKEKGGKERDALVLLAYQENFINFVKKGIGTKQLIFGKVDKLLDVHSFRRRHSQLFYEEIMQHIGETGKGGDGIYRRRDDRKVFDRYALKLTSRQLGHNRLDIVVKHYLD